MNHGLPTVSERLSSLLQRHPKRITALVAALLLGGGGGAFAVASLGPDAADLPVQQISEAVQPLAMLLVTEMPALLTNMSSRPCVASIGSITAAQLSSSVTSSLR